jgi:hypothetical protein
VGQDAASRVLDDEKRGVLAIDLPGQHVGCVPFRVQGIDAAAAKQRLVGRAPRLFEQVVDCTDVIESGDADAHAPRI